MGVTVSHVVTSVASHLKRIRTSNINCVPVIFRNVPYCPDIVANITYTHISMIKTI